MFESLTARQHDQCGLSRSDGRGRTLRRWWRQQTHLLPILLVLLRLSATMSPHLLHLLLGKHERLKLDLVLVARCRKLNRMLNVDRDG